MKDSVRLLYWIPQHLLERRHCIKRPNDLVVSCYLLTWFLGWFLGWFLFHFVFFSFLGNLSGTMHLHSLCGSASVPQQYAVRGTLLNHSILRLQCGHSPTNSCNCLINSLIVLVQSRDEKLNQLDYFLDLCNQFVTISNTINGGKNIPIF